MKISKKDIIQKLYELEEQEGLKLGREVQKTVRNETIPIDVIKLINKYDKEFLQIYDTFNTIYLARNKNPLYKNLRNKNININELAIALSSFVTKILISCSKIEDIQDRNIYAKAMNIEQLSQAIIEYSLYNNPTNLIECGNQIRELFEILYTD